jgi:FKBP-type peptidyl-prolyl cis-trans isomerase FklB
MKYFFAALIFGLFACQVGYSQKKSKKAPKAPKPMALKTNQDSIGYAIGMDIGGNLKRQGIELNADALAKGLKDAYNASGTQMTDAEVGELMATFQRNMQAKQEASKRAAIEENKRKGEEFLANNKTKPGIIVLPSGLQYEVIKEGTGRQPSATDKVTTHYHGMLIDGTVFDSSVDRGEPATFPVNGVIQAWQIILPMMKEGGKVRIFSPSELAYGAQGAGGKIGPNAVLIFEIELIKVQ